MSTQFLAVVMLSVVWPEQSNEKLKGKSFVSPPRVMKDSWDSVQAGAFLEVAGMIDPRLWRSGGQRRLELLRMSL